MNQIEFSVPGEPESWKVFSRADNNPRSERYESKARLNAYQDLIRIAARAAMQGLPPHEGAVDLEMWFYRRIKDSAPKRILARNRWIEKRNPMQPDTTNYQKGAEDALQGIVFIRDGQVSDVKSHKRYAEEAQTVFLVKLL